MIIYADDEYFFFEGDNWEETKLPAEKTMPKIVDWLKKVWDAGECFKNRSLFILNQKIRTQSCQCDGREHISCTKC